MERDWLDDSSSSDEQVLAHFDALPDGGELEFADPLARSHEDFTLPARLEGTGSAIFRNNTWQSTSATAGKVSTVGLSGDIFTPA